MKVKDVMHKGTTCVEPKTPLIDIAKHMRDDDIGAIPVRADGRLIGIVTDRDITCRAVAHDGNISQVKAQDIMTKGVVCCSPEDDLAAAIKLMEKKKIRRLAVTNAQNAMVGMLSLGDISLKASDELSGEMLRAVSAHH